MRNIVHNPLEDFPIDLDAEGIFPDSLDEEYQINGGEVFYPNEEEPSTSPLDAADPPW